MADDKSSAGKGAPPGKPGKRPYATLDLKATEIKVTPIAQKADAAATNGGPNNAKPAAIEVPLPAPASSYATKPDARDQSKSEARMQAEPSKSEKVKAASSAASNASFAARTAGSDTDAKVVVEKHGGFFSHLTAGILGGVLAFLALQWALPELGLDGALSSRFTNDTAAISARIAGLEKRVTRNASAPDLNAVEDRVAGLEKTVQTIPALTDSQRRLVADTKAALASAASDSGSPQLIERLGKVEDKLKALADAGANDPNAGRVEQLAALTAKVTDLETSLSTQLSVLARQRDEGCRQPHPSRNGSKRNSANRQPSSSTRMLPASERYDAHRSRCRRQQGRNEPRRRRSQGHATADDRTQDRLRQPENGNGKAGRYYGRRRAHRGANRDTRKERSRRHAG